LTERNAKRKSGGPIRQKREAKGKRGKRRLLYMRTEAKRIELYYQFLKREIGNRLRLTIKRGRRAICISKDQFREGDISAPVKEGKEQQKRDPSSQKRTTTPMEEKRGKKKKEGKCDWMGRRKVAMGLGKGRKKKVYGQRKKRSVQQKREKL